MSFLKNSKNQKETFLLIFKQCAKAYLRTGLAFTWLLLGVPGSKPSSSSLFEMVVPSDLSPTDFDKWPRSWWPEIAKQSIISVRNTESTCTVSRLLNIFADKQTKASEGSRRHSLEKERTFQRYLIDTYFFVWQGQTNVS